MSYKVTFKTAGGSSYNMNVNLNDKVTSHFTMDETINKSCKASIKCVFTPRMMTFLDLREEFRNDYYAKYKKPMGCTSCYREKAYNRSVGGIDSSLHCKGLAADLLTNQPVTDSVFAWCKSECEKLSKKYGTVMELGRYNKPDRIHIGMDITYQKNLYTFDKRTK